LGFTGTNFGDFSVGDFWFGLLASRHAQEPNGCGVFDPTPGALFTNFGPHGSTRAIASDSPSGGDFFDDPQATSGGVGCDGDAWFWAGVVVSSPVGDFDIDFSIVFIGSNDPPHTNRAVIARIGVPESVG